MDDLEPGDFVYQSDQELFLVVTGTDEDTVHFAVHGWRKIDKERLAEYIDHQSGKLYRQEQVDQLVGEEASEEEQEYYTKLLEMFEHYRDIELDEEGPHSEFIMEDT